MQVVALLFDVFGAVAGLSNVRKAFGDAATISGGMSARSEISLYESLESNDIRVDELWNEGTVWKDENGNQVAEEDVGVVVPVGILQPVCMDIDLSFTQWAALLCAAVLGASAVRRWVRSRGDASDEAGALRRRAALWQLLFALMTMLAVLG